MCFRIMSRWALLAPVLNKRRAIGKPGLAPNGYWFVSAAPIRYFFVAFRMDSL